MEFLWNHYFLILICFNIALVYSFMIGAIATLIISVHSHRFYSAGFLAF